MSFNFSLVFNLNLNLFFIIIIYKNEYVAIVQLLMIFSIITIIKQFLNFEIIINFKNYTFQGSRASEIIARPESGQLCCAKWLQASGWYRAQVKQVFYEIRKVCYCNWFYL